jgi:hypothetical protein
VRDNLLREGGKIALTTAIPHIQTAVARMLMGILMFVLLNIRQYKARIENLTVTMTPV